MTVTNRPQNRVTVILLFKPAPTNRAPQVGEIIFDVDLGNWVAGETLVMRPNHLDETFLSAIEGIIFCNSLDGQSEPPEATTLVTDQSLWGNVSFEFVTGQPISLAELAANLDHWPLRCAIVLDVRGNGGDILGVIVRGDAQVSPRGGSDLRDHSIGGKYIGLLSMGFDEASKALAAVAAAATDDSGSPAPVVNPLLVVMPYSRNADTTGKTGLPICRPIALPDEAAWRRLKEALIAAGFPVNSVHVYGIDPDKVYVRPWALGEP
jgi:hypothetical protein